MTALILNEVNSMVTRNTDVIPVEVKREMIRDKNKNLVTGKRFEVCVNDLHHFYVNDMGDDAQVYLDLAVEESGYRRRQIMQIMKDVRDKYDELIESEKPPAPAPAPAPKAPAPPQDPK